MNSLTLPLRHQLPFYAIDLYRRGERSGSMTLWQPPALRWKVPIPAPTMFMGSYKLIAMMKTNYHDLFGTGVQPSKIAITLYLHQLAVVVCTCN